MLSATHQAREQVVRGQVLERGEPLAQRAHLVDGQGSALRVEAGDRLPYGEVARGLGLRPCEVAGEEPIRGPFADPRQRRQRGLDLVVRKGAEAGEVEVAARETDDVVGLAAGEAEGSQLLGLRAGQPHARREGIRVLGPDAEALDEAIPDREGGVQRDLLGGDRRDEALERLDGNRRRPRSSSTSADSVDSLVAKP